MYIINHKDTVNILNSGITPIHKLKFNSKQLPPLMTIYGYKDHRYSYTKGTQKIKLLDMSTIEAVLYMKEMYHDDNIMFVNFANEKSRGGKPGMRWNYTNSYVYTYGNRAYAQEENIIEKSTAFLSLAKIKYPFNSEEICYVSPVEIFATDHTKSSSILIPELTRCYMIISASENLSYEVLWSPEMKKIILDKIRKRIRNQLIAADKITEIRDTVEKDLNIDNTNKKNILILGAFGCGAFSPNNWDISNNYAFAEDVAKLYYDLLNNEWSNSFDEVIFAVPTFGSINPYDKNYMNYMAFGNIFGF